VTLGYLCTRRRRAWPFWILVAALPAVPDLDTLGLGRANSIWGHRGFTHSLGFALALGLTATVVVGWHLRMSFWRLAVLFSVIAASHGLLDLLTTAGNGVALWWPISDERLGPFGPIPVADLSVDWPDPQRSRAVRWELLYLWIPCAALVVVVMLWRRGWGRRAKKVCDG
jgi:inner membrane protein